MAVSTPALSSSPNPPMSAEFYSSLGSAYETAFGHDQGLLRFLQRLAGWLPPNAAVLDIGCGTGNPVASTLTRAGHRLSGIDISDEMVKLSRAAVPSGNFAVADMQTYEPPPGSHFDAVLAILSLFPLDREAIEAQVARWEGWIGRGGLLSICSIAAEDIDVAGRSSQYDADGQCARDITFQFMGESLKITLFTRAGWKALLSKHGFELVDDMTELFVPPPEAQSEEEMHYFMVAKKAG